MSRATKQEQELQRIRGERHVYLSTACYHDRHEQCRNVCAHCPAPCCCTCHPVHRRAEA